MRDTDTRQLNIYEDIMDLPHHRSETRPPMPVADRAAQFSAFAALTGHSEAVREMGRYTDEKIELDERSREILDDKLRMLLQHAADRPVVTVTYFVPDASKQGGEYTEITGAVKRVDIYRKEIMMENEKVIPMSDIIDMNGDVLQCRPDGNEYW